MLHIWLRLPEEDRWDVTTCCRSNQTTPYLYSQRGLWDDGTTACHNETSVSFFFSRLPVRWLVVQLGASSPDIIRKWLTLSITGIKRSGPNRWKHSLFIFLCCFYTLQIRKHKQMNTVLSFDSSRSEKERSTGWKAVSKPPDVQLHVRRWYMSCSLTQAEVISVCLTMSQVHDCAVFSPKNGSEGYYSTTSEGLAL